MNNKKNFGKLRRYSNKILDKLSVKIKKSFSTIFGNLMQKFEDLE